jgi:hypothetical protein
LPVHQALAFHAFHGGDGAVNVAAPESGPVIISEVKLGQITVQVLFLAMLIDALHAAFEDRERTFNRIRVDVAASVFAN